MIVLTGAGGFVGSVILGYLNKQGIEDVVLFDDLPSGDQFKNLIGKRYISLHSTDEIFENVADIDAVVHFGANSSTLEKDWSKIYQTNILSTRAWNQICLGKNIPFIFASSAAVYGNGAGPLNHYAFSKMISENEITGSVLRLFNVYGPNEYHKDRMASTIYHWYNQLKDKREIQVFENSDRYLRDFVWVEDVAKTVFHLLYTNYQPGVYDLGSGNSVSFDRLSEILLDSVGHGDKNYIKMPDDLSKQYQISTIANNENLQKIGVDTEAFLSVEQGISKYLEFLASDRYY
jgi:ADP-L-glycero-D-manno-heptose 6-epimerase